MIKLDILEVMKPRLKNYDTQTILFVCNLKNIYRTDNVWLVSSVKLNNVQAFVVSKNTYYCQAHVQPDGKKLIKIDFPWIVMIGSTLDFILRHLDLSHVSHELLLSENVTQLKNVHETYGQQDILAYVYTCFLVNGSLKQFPLYITNNRLNYHLVKGKPIVRKYMYKNNEGTQINYRFEEDILELSCCRGKLTILREAKYHAIFCFRKSCDLCHDLSEELDLLFSVTANEYHILPALYHTFKFYSKKQLNIDHLGNKLVIEPGEFLNLIFNHDIMPVIGTKSMPSAIKSSKKAVLSGKGLFHVFSKRTVFEKETVHNISKYKYVKTSVKGVENNNRQYGEGGVVFFESTSNAYLNVNLSAPQLIPFLSNTAKKILSCKVKDNKALSFNKSHTGFICPIFSPESKNIGKIVSLCRDVYVSCQSPEVLNLSEEGKDLTSGDTEIFILVINNVPSQVSNKYFQSLVEKMYNLKKQYKFIEIYVENDVENLNFMFIRYDSQCLFKYFRGIYITPNDFEFWMKWFNEKPVKSVLDELGWEFLSSWWSVFIPFSKHNLAQKNLLYLNNLRNAITATTNILASVFCEPNTTFQSLNSRHEPIFQPETKLSELYQVYLPKLNVLYTWYRGYNQEDCMVLNSDVSFLIHKHVTVRMEISGQIFKLEGGGKLTTELRFQNVTGSLGSSNPVCLGRVYEINSSPIEISPSSSGLICRRTSRSSYNIHYNKSGDWLITGSTIAKRAKQHQRFDLVVHLEKKQTLTDGDKLCSVSGQKGVAKLVNSNELPSVSQGGILWEKPDLIMHPDSVMRRQTLGQIKCDPKAAMVFMSLENDKKQRLEGKALYCRSDFAIINYRSQEHIYVAKNCVFDAVNGQPTKGANRNGGMKSGIMEIRNCLHANGVSKLAEEILHENSDRVIWDDCITSRAYTICNEDAKFFKCHIVPKKKRCVSYTKLH